MLCQEGKKSDFSMKFPVTNVFRFTRSGLALGFETHRGHRFGRDHRKEEGFAAHILIV